MNMPLDHNNAHTLLKGEIPATLTLGTDFGLAAKTRPPPKTRAGIKGMTIYEVKGHGTQKGIKLIGRGGEYCLYWIDKLKLEIVITDDVNMNEIIDVIIEHAKTGKPGDGKIIVTPVLEAIRIRTKENGEQIL